MNGALEDALRRIEVLADLQDDQIRWLADRVEELRFEAGEVTFQAGAPADHMIFMLEGEVEAHTEPGQPQLPPFIAAAGEVTGLLPHSRMKAFNRTARTVRPTWAAQLHKDYFDEMLEVIPELETRLVGIMSDRIREATKADLQHEKLAALGKLASGLAHELNNPAAAVARGSETMRDRLAELRAVNRRLATADLSRDQRLRLADFEEEAVRHARTCTALDALTRSDREQSLTDWLEELGVESAWELAGELTDAGFTHESLTEVAAISGTALGDVLSRVSIDLSLDRLSSEMLEAAARMSGLVRNIKEYSFMDTTALRRIDIHKGLENTLAVLGHHLKHGIRVERDYDRNLPEICANGGELNQVWTNLIDNAISAMKSETRSEKVLRVRTALRGETVLVEISDTGPGIPDAIRSRIFEPYFTTKKQGDGTGLGLDLVQRIVRNHRGHVSFESRPGATCFQVRLPVSQINVPETS